ncbi:hypothetical protein C2S51_036076 [Perilla frutescens var. frutescens]|nr:hypothetical protein C2S51_036076 [Perilla frutescens var. frutescens]
MIEGSNVEQYSRLWDYANTLKEKNPGLTMILDCDITPTGVLLTVVGTDLNNDPYLLSYAIVSSENKESWEWVLQLLKDDLLTEVGR